MFTCAFYRPIATVIVQHGTLMKGDILVAGQVWGKIRTMVNEQKKMVKSAPPSTPVVTVGWKELPSAGYKCLEVSPMRLPFLVYIQSCLNGHCLCVCVYMYMYMHMQGWNWIPWTFDVNPR